MVQQQRRPAPSLVPPRESPSPRATMWLKPPKVRPHPEDKRTIRPAQPIDLLKTMSLTAEKIHEQNAGLRRHIEEQSTAAASQQSRIDNLVLEQTRLGAGRIVPAWVVSNLDQTLSAAEARQTEAQHEITRLNSELAELHERSEGQHEECASLRDQLTRQRSESIVHAAVERAAADAELAAADVEISRLRDERKELRGMLLGKADALALSDGEGEEDGALSVEAVRARLAEQREHASKHGAPLDPAEAQKVGSLFDLPFLPPPSTEPTAELAAEPLNDDGSRSVAFLTEISRAAGIASGAGASEAAIAATNAEEEEEAAEEAKAGSGSEAQASPPPPPPAKDDVRVLSRAAFAATEHAAATPEEIVEFAQEAARGCLIGRNGERSGDVSSDMELSSHMSTRRGVVMSDADQEEVVTMVGEIARLRSELVAADVPSSTDSSAANEHHRAAGAQGARAAAAATRAAERLVAISGNGLSVAESVAVALSGSIESAAVAAATATRVMQQQGEGSSGTAATIAAHTSARLLESGATPSVSVAAGERAAMAITRGESLETVHADLEALAHACEEKHRWECNLQPVDAPSWSMEGWLASLSLEKVVTKSARQRFDATIQEQHGGDSGSLPASEVRRYEKPFVEMLGSCGSVDTVLLLLKESPLLFDLATAIYEGAVELKALSDHAAAEEAAGEEMAGGEGEGAEVALGAEELNQKFIEDAGELFFAHQPSVYWSGLESLVGSPSGRVGLFEAMELEHTCREDADVAFTARNYG